LDINAHAVNYLGKSIAEVENSEIYLSCKEQGIPYKTLPLVILKSDKPNTKINFCPSRTKEFVSSDGLYLYCISDLKQEYVIGSVENISLSKAIENKKRFFKKNRPICMHCNNPLNPPSVSLSKHKGQK
jgi:hypothetical protein